MSVVPHRSDKPELQAAASPARQRAINIATSMAERIAKLTDKTAKIDDKAPAQSEPAQTPPAQTAPSQVAAANAVGAEPLQSANSPAAEPSRERKVLAEIERTRAKLKERAKPERLKQDYKNYLFWLHERVLDPPVESLFFKPTKDPVPLAGLTIRGNNREYGHDYRPTPCALFDWLISAINYDLSRLTFIDYGAGKGRALLLASQHPFHAVGGIEFAEELHDDAMMNIMQFPRSRMKCRNVECVLDDASQIGTPGGEAVHYFFNPFSREVFAEVLHNIVVSYRQRPRRLYLILIDPVATDLIDNSGVFQRLNLPLIERSKVMLLSPYEVAIYRSLA